MQEEQKTNSLEEGIRREAHAFLDQEENETLNAAYTEGMFVRLAAAALERWLPSDESTTEITEQFVTRAHWHLRRIFSREIQQRRLEGDIATCLNLSAAELLGPPPSALPDDFQLQVFDEAGKLLYEAEKAAATEGENADLSYVARAFHRLAEAILSKHPIEKWPTDDISAIAQTAEAYLGKNYKHSLQLHMAGLMNSCLQRAFEEEGRKIVFPILDYRTVPEPKEEELEDYGTGYDPLKLHKFTERIFKYGVYRIRADDNEILHAIREFDENIFPEWTTPEEYIRNMNEWGWPAEIRERAIASLDAELAAQPEQTPEVVAAILRQRRNGMLNGRAHTIFQTFMSYSDHGMRCGIAACLFLAKHYADANYLLVSGASDDVVDRALPYKTDLQRHVAAYFADWLTRPLLTRSLPGKRAYAQIELLLAYYESLLPQWEEASRFCQDALRSASPIRQTSWRDEIAKNYPDLDNQPRLIERLPPKHQWVQGLTEEVREDHRSSKAADIALEHAARMCGAADYKYALSTLQQNLRKHRRKQDCFEEPESKHDILE
jgi:hypothetical protein